MGDATTGTGTDGPLMGRRSRLAGAAALDPDRTTGLIALIVIEVLASRLLVHTA